MGAAAATVCGPLSDAGLPADPGKQGLRACESWTSQEGLCHDRNRGACSGILFVFSVAALKFCYRCFFFFLSLIKFDYLKFGCAAQHVGSSFPNQESNACLLQLKCGILTAGRPREVPSMLFVSLWGEGLSVLTEGWGGGWEQSFCLGGLQDPLGVEVPGGRAWGEAHRSTQSPHTP